MRFFQDTNFYFYVHNNPVNFVDSSGLQDLRPRNVPPGTGQQYWQPIADGFSQALNRLNNTSCAELFGPCREDVDRTGFNTLFQTQYRFVSLGQGSGYGAQTVNVREVQINSQGTYMTAWTGWITLPGGLRLFLGNITNIRAFVLLHELGHQLKGHTGFIDDAADPNANLQHSLLVLRMCFPEAMKPLLDLFNSFHGVSF